MATTVNNSLLDPLQGFDVKVTVQAHTDAKGSIAAGQLIGAFTSLMFKIVNQTETYLTLNSRVPRMLDGEVIIVWSLEQGLVNLDIVANTFGSSFATGLKNGRSGQIPRSQRFQIIFETNLAPDDITNMAASDTGFNQDQTNVTNGRKYTMSYCRVDTSSFGVTAGRHIVANTWQGTAQNISVMNEAQTKSK